MCIHTEPKETYPTILGCRWFGHEWGPAGGFMWDADNSHCWLEMECVQCGETKRLDVSEDMRRFLLSMHE